MKLNTILKLIGGGIFIILLSFWISIITKDLFSSPIQRILDRNYKIKYSGVVVKKYVDHKNHAFNIIVLTSGEEVVMPAGEGGLYNLIQVGDSMHKDPNTFIGVYISNEVETTIDYDTWLRENFKDEL